MSAGAWRQAASLGLESARVNYLVEQVRIAAKQASSIGIQDLVKILVPQEADSASPRKHSSSAGSLSARQHVGVQSPNQRAHVPGSPAAHKSAHMGGSPADVRRSPAHVRGSPAFRGHAKELKAQAPDDAFVKLQAECKVFGAETKALDSEIPRQTDQTSDVTITDSARILETLSAVFAEEHADHVEMTAMQAALHGLRTGTCGDTVCLRTRDLNEYAWEENKCLRKMWFADLLDAVVSSTFLVTVVLEGMKLDAEV